jgi:hypothetical protein
MLAALSFVSAGMGDIRGSGALGAGLALIFVALAIGSFIAERRSARRDQDANTGEEASVAPAVLTARRTDGASDTDHPSASH